MAAIADIAVYDGAATPVLHTLKAVSVTRNNGVVEALYREELTNVPVSAQPSFKMKLEQLKSGVYKSEGRMTVPVMESVSGQNAAGYTAAPKIAFEDSFILTGYHHDRSTSTSRTLAKQMLINIGNNVTTSVAAASAGPYPLMVGALVMPT